MSTRARPRRVSFRVAPFPGGADRIPHPFLFRGLRDFVTRLDMTPHHSTICQIRAADREMNLTPYYKEVMWRQCPETDECRKALETLITSWLCIILLFGPETDECRKALETKGKSRRLLSTRTRPETDECRKALETPSPDGLLEFSSRVPKRTNAERHWRHRKGRMPFGIRPFVPKRTNAERHWRPEKDECLSAFVRSSRNGRMPKGIGDQLG